MGGATAANQLEGAFDRDGKGLSVADAMPGGKQRLAILGSDTFDWTIDEDKYTYPNHRGSTIMTVSKKTLRCLRKWASRAIVFQSLGHVFFQR